MYDHRRRDTKESRKSVASVAIRSGLETAPENGLSNGGVVPRSCDHCHWSVASPRSQPYKSWGSEVHVRSDIWRRQRKAILLLNVDVDRKGGSSWYPATFVSHPKERTAIPRDRMRMKGIK